MNEQDRFNSGGGVGWETGLNSGLADLDSIGEPDIAENLSSVRQVALIDTSVDNYEVIAAGFSSDVEVIPFHSDGTLSQISDILHTYRGLQAVHLVSHGSTGAITLGGVPIDSEGLEANASALTGIGNALSADGDILLYGCDVGADERGRAFVDRFASLTGADVAASDGVTGAAALGGDWDLEVASGTIDASSEGIDSNNRFAGLLASTETFDDAGLQQAISSTSLAVNGWTFTAASPVTMYTLSEAETYPGYSSLLNSANPSDRVLDWNYQGDVVQNYGFQSTDGSEFKLNSFSLDIRQQAGPGNPKLTLTVYKDGTPVSFSTTLDLASSYSSNGISYILSGTNGFGNPYGTLMFDSTYQNVDRVELAFANGVAPIMDDLNVSAAVANNAPTVSGVPSDISVVEDTASNFDLSALTLADADGDNLTVTLAVDAGTFGTPADGSGVGAGVAETLVNSTTITLAGTAADINNYLDSASNLQYTGASNASGDNQATLTINANDGTVNPQVGSANIDITAVNDAPVASAVPTDVTVTEDAASNFDLSGVTLTDVDGDNLTVTLAASAGAFTAASGGGVTVGGSGTGSLTLAGTAANINTFLDTLSNVQYTGASNASGDNAATFTINANDGTVNPQVGSGNIDITAVNDAPAFSGLDGAPSYTEGDPAVTLDANVTISDFELSVASNYAGSSLTIARNGGASAADSFSFDTTGAVFTVSGGDLQFGGLTFATFANSGGTLTVDSTSSGTAATQALVNDVLQHIQYQNTSDDPAASVQLDWTFSDGNTGAQGSGGAQVATGSTRVSLTNINDAPSLSATGSDPTYVEGSAAADLFSAVTASTTEASNTTDHFTALTLTVTNVSDGANEILRFDGSDVALTDGNSVVGTATNGLTVNVSLSGGTATVSISGASLTEARMQTLVDEIAYRNTSDNPTTGANRVVAITEVVDDGGTANGGVDTATLNLQSTISLTPVNDAPVIGDLDGDNGAVQGGGRAVTIDAGGNATVSNVDSADYNGGSLTIVDTGGNNTASGNFAVDGINITSGGDATLAAGETISVGGIAMGTVDATSDGQGGNTLTIDFNSADATNARVQTLLQNLTWSAAAGSGVQTFTATLNDGDGIANGGDQDTTANFTMKVGNLPVVGNLDGDSINFKEGDTPVVLDAGGNAMLSDPDAPASLGGGKLTATVVANAMAGEDVLTFDTTGGVTLSGTTAGSSVAVGGTVVGTLGNNIAAGNGLVVNLGANATLARTQTLLQSVAYGNDSAAPTAATRSVQVTVTDNDGLTSAASRVSVAVASVNDAPTLTATGADPTFTEDGTAATLFTGASTSTVEAGQSVSGLTLTVSNLADGADERLSVDGTEIALMDGTSGTTAASGIGYAVSLTGTTATVSLDGNLSTAAANALIDGLSYRNTSHVPATTGGRTVTLTRVTDDGGAASGGTDTTVLAIGSTVTLNAVNDAPVFTSPAALSVTENTTAVTTLAATDADGDPLTYALAGGADQTLFTLDAGSGALSFRSAPNVEVPADSNGDNVYDVQVTAADGQGGTTPLTLAVTVTDVNEAPTLGGAATLSVAENTTGTVYTASGSDPESDPLTYTLGGTDAALFTLDTNSGALHFNTAPDFEAPADTGSDNVYDVTLTATDGNLSSRAQALAISVTDANEAPVFTSASAVSMAENITAVTTLAATDAEGDSLTYALAGGADQTLFTLDAGSGALSFRSAPNFEVPADSNGDNVYDVQVTAADGRGGTTPLTLAVTVTNINESSPPAPDPIQVTSPSPQPDTPSGQPSVSETITNTGRTPGSARLVENSGNANEVTATLPGGVSLVNQGARSAVSIQQAQADLIGNINAQQPGNLSDQTGVASQWLAHRPDGTLLDIRTLTLNDSGSASASTPIQITGIADGGTASGGHQEAFVIDTRALPTGNQLQLDNIDFASVIGATTLSGGDGANVVIADDAAQTIVLGADDDELHGGGGDDTVGSKGGDDRIYGEAGNDTLFGGAGADRLHGGTDTDTAQYDGNRADYLVTQDHGVITVQSKADPGDVDTLINVEKLSFADGDQAVDYAGDLNWLAGLYQQVLGRQADVGGIQYWARQHDAGLQAADIAMGFLTSSEANLSLDTADAAARSQVVETLYQSLLGRSSDAAGKVYWLEQLESDSSLRDVAGGFMDSAEMSTHDLTATEWNFMG
ncbi:DUF4347 domain-containing protein [Modicisalibacter sp. 'Wilcox']|uniref:DUF4347 domain-containing protein n=1 Tax=Modicisalibacter sp. 'Wilcox' TaxID=2679914 RepID=UPI0013D754BC|nr:DUF4347 domain-containing protein [Modicisalibacter sp. 'Wilcox']